MAQPISLLSAGDLLSVAVEVQDSVNSSSEIPVTQPPKLATNLNVIQSVTSISSDHEPEIEAEPPPQDDNLFAGLRTQTMGKISVKLTGVTVLIND